MAAQWEEEQKMEEIVPELAVHERLSQGNGVKGFKKEKKMVPDGLLKR